VLDEYERRARLLPGLLAVAPVAVLVLAFGLDKAPVVTTLLSLLIAIGGPVLLSQFVRSKGKAVEEQLYADWGGIPTTQLLRLDGFGQDALRVQRRTELERAVAVTLPTLEDEQANPEASDRRYEAAVARLRERTRAGDDFNLIKVEVRNYGFERNLFALRFVGVIVSSAALVAIASAIILHVTVGQQTASGLSGGLAIAVLALLLAAWILYPSPNRVKAAAYVYAERTLDAAINVQ
jgi:hypothetical protein